jgi:hypothetical protein
VAVIANSRPCRIALVRVARRHAEAGAGEGFAQRRSGGSQLVGGGIDAAELFGELESTFGLGPVGEELAGLPAQPALGHAKVPLGLRVDDRPARSPRPTMTLSAAGTEVMQLASSQGWIGGAGSSLD